MTRRQLPEAGGESWPALLVSVRSLAEARSALRGGAAVIDVKEPARGALGRAPRRVQRAVAEAVAERAEGDGVLITAALGELRSWRAPGRWTPVPGIGVYKLGLAGCRRLRRWTSLLDSWREHVAASGELADLAAVAYADHVRASAPPAEEVLEYALGRRLPFLLIDTFDKRSGSLWSWVGADRLRVLLRHARRSGLRVALAGSLGADDMARAAALAPDVLAVRGAACDGGRRGGRVDEERVRDLVRRLRAAGRTTPRRVARAGGPEAPGGNHLLPPEGAAPWRDAARDASLPPPHAGRPFAGAPARALTLRSERGLHPAWAACDARGLPAPRRE